MSEAMELLRCEGVLLPLDDDGESILFCSLCVYVCLLFPAGYAREFVHEHRAAAAAVLSLIS